MTTRSEQLPLGAAWAILFVAVLAHMPSLRGYFAQDDWGMLARGAGEVPGSWSAARPFGSFLYWRLTWPLFGAGAQGYHVCSLLMVALTALWAARVGLRIGLDRVGTSIAGLVVAASPLWTIPVFWVSATQEILAILFALVAIECWLLPARWRWLTLPLGALSFASKEGALGLGIWLAFLPGASSRSLRSWLGLAALCGFAALAALAVWNAIPHAAGDAYALGGLRAILRNFGLFGAWLLSPLPTADLPLLRWLGGGVWLGWAIAAWIVWRRRGEILPALALLWALLALLPVLALQRHLYPYYSCSALLGWAWLLGWLAQQLTAPSWSLAMTPRPALLSWFALCLGATIFSSTASNAYLSARDRSGLHRDPLVQRSSIAAACKRLIQELPLQSGDHLAVLQATRSAAAADSLPGVLIGSPVFLALSGPVGLARLAPAGVQVSWTSHLDDVPLRGLVLLDDGAPFLRPLGDTANARIYSALIAVAAGQFARARHDLWNVVGPLGSQVRWVYDADALPVEVSEIQRGSAGFARYLIDGGTPSDGRILRTFEQVYEALTGEPLLQAPWGEPVRG